MFMGNLCMICIDLEWVPTEAGVTLLMGSTQGKPLVTLRLVAIAGDLPPSKASFRPGKGVIHHVIPAPAAVGRQVGLHAVPHRRGLQLLALGLVLTP